MAFNHTNNPLSPQRNPNRLSAGGMSTSNGGELRGGLTRRFTMNALPTLSPIGQQRMQAAGETLMPSGMMSRVPPSERRMRHIEGLIAQQRRIEAELEKVDDETRREIEENLRHERAVTQMIAQSEPTTPPEYQDAFSTRTNRYSATSLTSPPGIQSRTNRSSTQLTSPSVGVIRPFTATNHSSNPSQSVPGSRRESDDEGEDSFLYYDTSIHRAAANPNRNSMPVTSYDRTRNAAAISSALGPINTTSFLFDDDDQPSSIPTKSTQTSPPDTKTFLQVQHTADGFPKLIRRGDYSEPVSGSSAALDLALSPPSNGDRQGTDRATASRHRISLPLGALSSNGNIAPLNSILAVSNDAKSAANNRRSTEVKFTAETKRPALMSSPPRGMPNGMLKTQSSYSTNDIPTLKAINSENSGGVPISPPTQAINVVNAVSSDQNSDSYNQITAGSAGNINHQNQNFSGAVKPQDTYDTFNSLQSGSQGNPASFAPGHAQEASNIQPFQPPSMPQYGQSALYGGYNMQMLNNGFNSMNINGGYGSQGQFPNQMPQYQQGGYGGYQQYPQNGQVVPGAGRYSDSQRSAQQQRKVQAEEFYNAVSISELAGQIYGLCKDQHGCRYLQKKLEEGDAQDVQIIFNEVKDHFHELMIDPFGNYLCQRLLEHTSEEHRTALIQNACPGMTKIALNQHGTRALQKMIEFINTPEQINMIIEALRFDVVQLIQDLNGNHVIQKCLNHLSSQDAQFIFDAVGANCVTVGTHRHGCCVLQRCVDHATGVQKGAMVNHIIDHAFALVQDPFGNYVVQYILDLTEPCFTEPLCRSFLGSISFLSKQKFSSNVIEKCIRTSGADTKRLLIQEIVVPGELEKLLRDSFANYVVQTAIDFSDEQTKHLLIEHIRPILPALRHTPHGRRIAGKIQDWDNGTVNDPTGAIAVRNMSQGSMGSIEPVSSPQPYAPHVPPASRANRMGMVGAPAQWGNNNTTFAAPSGANGYAGNGHISAPAPQRAQAYNMLNGNQAYQNLVFGVHDYPNMGRQAPPYF